MDENELSKIIVDSAIEVHRSLGGPGLLEPRYSQGSQWLMISLRLCPFASLR